MFVFIDLTRREQIVSSLDDKIYRDAFVAEQIRVGVPLQIRQMREAFELSQEQLGQQMEPPMVQESVWRLENPNKANLTIGTLLRVASAFDVALMVRFVPFSELVDSTPWLTGRDRTVPPFAKDTSLTSCGATTVIGIGDVSWIQATGAAHGTVFIDPSAVTLTWSVATAAQCEPPQTMRAANTQLAKVA